MSCPQVVVTLKPDCFEKTRYHITLYRVRKLNIKNVKEVCLSLMRLQNILADILNF